MVRLNDFSAVSATIEEKIGIQGSCNAEIIGYLPEGG